MVVGWVEPPQQAPVAALVTRLLPSHPGRSFHEPHAMVATRSPWKETLCLLPGLFSVMWPVWGEQDVFYTWDPLSWSPTTLLSAFNIKLMENTLCLLTIKVCFSSLLPPPTITNSKPLEHTERLLLHLSSVLSQGWPLHAWLAQGGLRKAGNSPHQPYNPQVAQTKYFLSHKNFSARNAWFTARFMFYWWEKSFFLTRVQQGTIERRRSASFSRFLYVGKLVLSSHHLMGGFLTLMVRIAQSYFNFTSLISVLHCFVLIWGTPLIEEPGVPLNLGLKCLRFPCHWRCFITTAQAEGALGPGRESGNLFQEGMIYEPTHFLLVCCFCLGLSWKWSKCMHVNQPCR